MDNIEQTEFSNEFFTKCKTEIFEICIQHFKWRENLDAMAFMNAFDNIVVYHTIKCMDVNKMKISEDMARHFCCYLRDNLIELGVLSGYMVEYWKEYKINNFEEMNKMTRVNFRLKRINDILLNQRIISTLNTENKMIEETKFQTKVSNYSSLCFNIFKILIRNKFYCEDDIELNGQKYQNQIFEKIKEYQDSEESTLIDRELIKSDPNISQLIMYICKNIEAIYNENEILRFNFHNIYKMISDYKQCHALFSSKIRLFVENYLNM